MIAVSDVLGQEQSLLIPDSPWHSMGTRDVCLQALSIIIYLSSKP